jgi:hypothetical protein
MIDEWISLRWERGTRYYEVCLHQDLWGDWVLTQVWDDEGRNWDEWCIPPAHPIRMGASSWLLSRRGGSNEVTQS